MAGLRYVGNAVIPGIPARDLSDREVNAYGGVETLVATGLYEEPKAKRGRGPKKDVGPSENKAEKDEKKNK